MWVWILFIVLILIFLILDLGVFHKHEHIIKTKEAALWTALWIAVAFSFSGVIYWLFSNGLVENSADLTPNNAVLKYITGYLVELSLSIDNIFVIAVIFSAFKVPALYQHRVLFWGILGAIFFRGVMIVFGVALIKGFDWINYVFGVFLLYTAFKMLKENQHEFDPKKAFLIRQIKKIFPITSSMHGPSFFINRMGVTAATPLFLTLITIELTDVLFAFDSIPAILAITTDPFIVFSSNILAILGLRSMYFLISRMLAKFRFINYSLVIILAFVGLKMIFSHQIDMSEWISLAVISISLIGGVLTSWAVPENKKNNPIN